MSSDESSEEEIVKVKHRKSAKTKSKDKKDKKCKKTEKSDNETSEDDAPVKKSKKDKGKDTSGETGTDAKAQNIMISAKQFQEVLDMMNSPRRYHSN